MKTGNARELLEHWGGNAPGFDALRVIFSVIIMAWHSYTICVGSDMMDNTAVQIVLRSILPMFFFLGGFLVTGSALRLKNTLKFFIFRTFRIFPALFVEVILSALVLGSIVTTLPLQEYYAHENFRDYFLNVFGIVHFFLPGVFETNPTRFVNVNLWTLPADLHGYILMLVLMAGGIIYKRKVFLGIFLLVSAYVFCRLPQMGWGMDANGKGVHIDETLLIYCFFIGVTAFLFADKIPVKKSFMGISFLGMGLLASYYTSMLGVFFACYFCLCLGFVDMRKYTSMARGDYSYGIYLYSFPIQQLLWLYVPLLRNPALLFIVALPLTVLFAVFSWHKIEKPILDLRKAIGPVVR